MALSYAFPTIPSSFCFLCLFHFNKSNNWFHKDPKIYKGFAGATTPSSSGGMRGGFGDLVGSHSRLAADFLITGDTSWNWRLNAVGIDSKTNSQAHIPTIHDNGSNASATLEIPVTCYQLIGVADQSEKDEIVKSVMDLRNAEIEEGYSIDAIASRQDLLMDVRDKLLFEPHYAGNMKENIPPKSSIRIPWAWLPSALCLLQEVGEAKIVLDIGQTVVQCPMAKPYMHDILLSMVLAECAIAKIGFEKNMVSQGFEALARAQYLLRSQTSLGKLKLLSQIEESLEELAPACTLELLGMPSLPMNTERRAGAIAALRELLRQGLDVETSCQVQDWPCFLSQALGRLMAAEMVDLLPWDDLALIRKNKKSIESQNQRVVVDFNCFYMAFKAHLALGFSSRQTELIEKAKTICECLIASESVDLKFEEAFCVFLLGQCSDAEVFEKLQQSSLNSKPAMPTRFSNSGMEKKNAENTYQSLNFDGSKNLLQLEDLGSQSPQILRTSEEEEFFQSSENYFSEEGDLQKKLGLEEGLLSDDFLPTMATSSVMELEQGMKGPWKCTSGKLMQCISELLGRKIRGVVRHSYNGIKRKSQSNIGSFDIEDSGDDRVMQRKIAE